MTTLDRIATDIYPTRYAAFEQPGRWAIFEPIDRLYRSCTAESEPRSVETLGAYKRGGEMAVLHLPQQNEHWLGIVDGTYIEVINNGSDHVARCQHTRPNRERSQVSASLRAVTRDDAMAAAEKWIVWLAT